MIGSIKPSTEERCSRNFIWNEVENRMQVLWDIYSDFTRGSTGAQHCDPSSVGARLFALEDELATASAMTASLAEVMGK